MLEDLAQKMDEKAVEAELRADLARTQLAAALRARLVGDPITTTLLGVTFWHFIAGVGISVALSLGTGLLMGALAKKQKVTQGDRGGQDMNVQRSAQGTGIPEIFGGDPGDGLGGGVKIAPIVAWLSRTPDGYVARKHISTQTTGGKGLGGSPKQEVTTITYDLDALLLWGRGPLILRKLWAATKLILRNTSDQTDSVNYYQAEDPGNTLAGGATVVADGGASGGSAVALPPGGSIQWNGVSGDGTGAILQFFYKLADPTTVEFTWVGSAGTSVFSDSINATYAVYAMGYNSAPFMLAADPSNSVKVRNTGAATIYFDRLGVRLPNTAIGIPNPNAPVDPTYNPNSPFDPIPDYSTPLARVMGALMRDEETGANVGNITSGNFAGIANYEGNGTEYPDPVVQAEVDGRLGLGSTPAYRRYATTRLANFYLTEYQEAFPPFWGLLEHKTIRNFGQLCEHLSARVGLQPDEYDYTDLYSVPLRGVAVQPPYTPKELMQTLAKLYNCYFYEGDKIYGLRMSSAPTFELDDADLGWVDEIDEDAQTFPELDGDMPAATEIPRRITLRYLSPSRNYDQNQQNEPRMATTGQREDTLDVTVTLTDEEARAYATRELYQDDVESTTHRFSLSYEHLYRNPGDIAIVNRDEGFTQQIRLTSIKPTLGVLDCAGEAVDTAVFTQPTTAPGGGWETPPVLSPGMAILGFYDDGALVTQDDGRSGFYAWVVKRTGPGVFRSAGLYKETPGLPQRLATFPAEATAGVVLGKLGPVTDTTLEDGLRPFTADAATDVLAFAEEHNFLNGEAIILNNAGGALPAGLSAGTVYYVDTVNTTSIRLNLTPGGSTVDFTSAGTGTNSAQRILEVDLYGTTATLETVSDEQIARGDNACLAGNEVLQVKTWEQVVGFPNRWRGRNFWRGRVHTETDVDLHSASERFLLLNDAVQFVEQDIASLNLPGKWRAVMAGASYDDSASVDFTWTGGALKAAPVPRLKGQRNSGTQDVFYDWDPARAGAVQEFALRIFPVGGTSPVRTTNQRTQSSEPLHLTRDDLLNDGTPVTSAAGGACTGVSSVATDGTYTAATTGAAGSECRYISQELRGDCIIQFEVDNRPPPRVFSTVGAAPRPVAVDPVEDTIRILGNNDLEIFEGQQCQLRLVGVGATLPGGIANEDAAYYIINYNGVDTFQLSLTPSGAAVDITSTGSGVRAHVISGASSITTTWDGTDLFIQPELAALLRKRPIPKEAYAIEMRGRQGRYFIPFTGDTRSPLFTSGATQLPNPFRVSIALGFLSGIAQAAVRPRVIYRSPNAFTYLRSMQNTDFNNAPPGAVICEIRQLNWVGTVAVEGRPRRITV